MGETVKYRYQTIQEALNNYTPNENGCFVFNGSKSHGYGIFSVNGKSYRAHRAAYENSYGSIKEDKFICHKCNNPSCINPLHLYEGTPASNGRDRRADNLKKYFKYEDFPKDQKKDTETKSNNFSIHPDILENTLEYLLGVYGSDTYSDIKQIIKSKKNKQSQLISVCLSKSLYTKLKQYSLLSEVTMSKFIRIAILKEIKELSKTINPNLS